MIYTVHSKSGVINFQLHEQAKHHVFGRCISVHTARWIEFGGSDVHVQCRCSSLSALGGVCAVIALSRPLWVVEKF